MSKKSPTRASKDRHHAPDETSTVTYPSITHYHVRSYGQEDDEGDSERHLLPKRQPQDHHFRHKQHRQSSKRHEYHAVDVAESSELYDDRDSLGFKWQVLKEYPILGRGMLQIVHLRHANFGFHWKRHPKRYGLHSIEQHEDNEEQNQDEHQRVTVLPPTWIVGPHWWLMAMTFTMFTAAALIVSILTIPQAGFGEAITGVLLSSACLSMYAMVGCTNPGIVPRISTPPDDTFTYCDHCESYRPPGALHCMDCRVCVEEYDHHCPWTGKCIGKRNIRYFYGWLFFLVLAFVYEIIEFTTYLLPPEDQYAMASPLDDTDSMAATKQFIQSIVPGRNTTAK